jgi:hypothetical protein
MGLLAHKQPKKFWLDGKNGVKICLDWSYIMKPELKRMLPTFI